MSGIIARAARDLETDPLCLAPALAAYRRRRDLDDGGLAGFLRCPADALYALALCRRPDRLAPGYAEAVAAIARYIGCDAERLAAVLGDA